jgi:acetyl-CoA synthetase
MADGKTIEAMLDEQRTFSPPADFRNDAVISSDAPYREAGGDLEGFWAKLAAEKLDWIRRWDAVLR